MENEELLSSFESTFYSRLNRLEKFAGIKIPEEDFLFCLLQIALETTDKKMLELIGYNKKA